MELKKEEIEPSIPKRFESMVRVYRNKLAIKTAGAEVTYQELNEKANCLAQALQTLSVATQEPIALCLDDDISMAIAIYGVLKTGNIYVHLDPALPKTRLNHIIEETQAALIITNNENEATAHDLRGENRRLLKLDAINLTNPAGDPGIVIDPAFIATIHYTSGSTGQPKGVIWSHRFVMGWRHSSNFSGDLQDKRITALGLAGRFNLFTALLNGATLYPWDIKKAGISGLASWLRESRVTHYVSVPAVFRLFTSTLTQQCQFPDLRTIVLYGEPVTIREIQLYKKHFGPECTLLCALGTTETGIIAEFPIHHETSVPGVIMPAGYQVPHRKVTLLNDAGQDVGINQIGEIAVTSRYCASGYWRRPDLTNAVFLRDNEEGQEKTYLTGDLGRMLPDGLIEYLGRKDFFLKIRGHGVSLFEIESALLEHAAVKEVAVAAWDRNNGEKYLAAYLILRAGCVSTSAQLRAFLKEKLPDYMIPSVFMFLESLPLTNGKLDRKALPRPDGKRPELSTAYVAPRGDREEKLVLVWEDVINIRPVGIHDNFFDLGGHSLSAARFIVQAQKQFHMEFTPYDLIEAPTVAQLAARSQVGHPGAASAGLKERSWRHLIAIHRGPSDRPIFCFPYAGGFRNEYFHFAGISRHLAESYSFYGLSARGGGDGKEVRHRRLEAMAADYVKEIKAVQPAGPYFLIGECQGGIAAYATAQELLAQRDQVGLLMFLDTPALFFDRYYWRRLTARLSYRAKTGSLPSILEYGFARAQAHLQVMRELQGGKRWGYAMGKVTKAAVTVVEMLRGPENAVQALDRPVAGIEAVPAQTNPDERACYLALRRYRAKRYPGRLTLLSAEDRSDCDNTLGWSKWIAGGIEVHTIPGNHDTCVPDNVELIARILRASVERAEGEGSEHLSGVRYA